MFGLFASKSFLDERLGELRRSRGYWRGLVPLDSATVPLAIAGSRTGPDVDALVEARKVPNRFASWRAAISESLLEHYAPYAEAVDAGEEPMPVAELPRIATATEVRPHVTPLFVRVERAGGVPTVEIGYRAAWDDEHTLAVLFQGGRFAGLNGSVLAP